MTVEIICVGTGLLLGNIINTNAAFLAQECAKLDLSCCYQTVVGDSGEHLGATLAIALERSDIVLLSGGLGANKDELTKETVAEVLGCKLVEDAASRQMIEAFFAMGGIAPTENNQKLALIPAGAKAIVNKNGATPGILAKKNGKHIILMPGEPGELRPMFLESVAPYLQSLESDGIASLTEKVAGVGENSADGQATLEKEVADLLMEKGYTMTTAESCTGGMLAARMINVPGVSGVFKAGFVTYANEAKHKLIGVREKTLETYGAVSKETAGEMVLGAAKAAEADVAVSITGIAGPDGGTRKKPVGLVYIGCLVNGKTEVKEYHFSGNRMKIRENAASAALVQLKNLLMEQ